MLLNSGCLCCSVRSDIVDTLLNLFTGRASGKVPHFARVVIETTGLADPAPILHTLISDPLIAARYCLDGVVVTVDAVNGAGTLDRQPEAVKQAAVADRLLLTKTDLAAADRVAGLTARLAALNPAAPILPVAGGAVDPDRLFNLGFYDPLTKSVDVQRWLRDEAFTEGASDGHQRSGTSIKTLTAMTTISAPSASPASDRSHGRHCRPGSTRWRRCAATICCG